MTGANLMTSGFQTRTHRDRQREFWTMDPKAQRRGCHALLKRILISTANRVRTSMRLHAGDLLSFAALYTLLDPDVSKELARASFTRAVTAAAFQGSS